MLMTQGELEWYQRMPHKHNDGGSNPPPATKFCDVGLAAGHWLVTPADTGSIPVHRANDYGGLSCRGVST